MAEGDRDVHHPSPAALDRFLLGEMSPGKRLPCWPTSSEAAESAREEWSLWRR